jgi:hypothetical protein
VNTGCRAGTILDLAQLSRSKLTGREAFLALLAAGVIGATATGAFVDDSFPGAPWLGNSGRAVDQSVTQADIQVQVTRIAHDPAGLAVRFRLMGARTWETASSRFSLPFSATPQDGH